MSMPAGAFDSIKPSSTGRRLGRGVSVWNLFALLAPSICDSNYKYFSEPGTAEM